jgi:hypothetical protein
LGSRHERMLCRQSMLVNLPLDAAGECNNDRLALLGDRVLDLIVLQQGMQHRPYASNLGDTPLAELLASTPTSSWFAIALASTRDCLPALSNTSSLQLLGQLRAPACSVMCHVMHARLRIPCCRAHDI